MASFVRRHDEIEGARIREVVLFHSSAEDLLRYAGDLPFAVVADPGRRIHREFGVESSPRSLLHPRAWWPIVRAVAHSLWAIIRRRQAPPLNPPGGRFGLPADVLVDAGGRVVARHHGTHVDDQWSVDEVLRAGPAGDRGRLRARPPVTAAAVPGDGDHGRPGTRAVSPDAAGGP